MAQIFNTRQGDYLITMNSRKTLAYGENADGVISVTTRTKFARGCFIQADLMIILLK